MNIQNIPYESNSDMLIAYKQSLKGIVDDFVEELIEGAKHYLLYDEGEIVGQVGVVDDTVTFFYIIEERKYKQFTYFEKLKELIDIQYAYASTADLDFFHILMDHNVELMMQAKFFVKSRSMDTTYDHSFIDFAKVQDEEEIGRLTDHEFDDLKERIQSGKVFSLKEEGALLGVGFISDSKMFKDQQTLGVFTNSKHRRKGVASSLVEYMSEKIWMKQKKVVAGCYYYNEASSKMLMHTGFRLMNILVKFRLK